MKISTGDLIFAAVIVGTVGIAGSFVLMPFVGFAHWQPPPAQAAPQDSSPLGQPRANGWTHDADAGVAALTVRNRARAASRDSGHADFILAPISLSPPTAGPCGE